jgi:hypothetical protein
LTFEANDLDGLLKEALVKVRDQIRTADRVIFLMQEGRQFAIKAAHGGRPGRQLPVEKVSRSILRRVRRTGRTLFLSDAMSDNGLGPRRSIQEIVSAYIKPTTFGDSGSSPGAVVCSPRVSR